MTITPFDLAGMLTKKKDQTGSKVSTDTGKSGKKGHTTDELVQTLTDENKEKVDDGSGEQDKKLVEASFKNDLRSNKLASLITILDKFL